MTDPNKDDFLASLPLAANTPPLPTGVPPLPPLPPSVPHYTTEENAVASALVAAVRPDLAAFVDAVPAVDRGYINPIDSTAVLAANPEEAAAVQGIEAPEPPPPDDLDDLTRDQLKALGVVTGAFPSNTRMREAGMRSAIRAQRVRAAFESEGEKAEPVRDEAPSVPALDIGMAIFRDAGLLYEEPAVSTDEPEAEALVDLQTDSTWEQYQRVQSGPEPAILSTLNEAADLLAATKAKADEAYARGYASGLEAGQRQANEAANFDAAVKAKVEDAYALGRQFERDWCTQQTKAKAADEVYDRGYVSGFEAGVRAGEATSKYNKEEVNPHADIQRIADTMGCEITLTFRPKAS